MTNVLPAEVILLAYLDNPISGTKRRALEVLERIEQSVFAGERWLVLAPALDRASSFITEQDITQSVAAIREEIERRGIEIVSGEAIDDIWAQTVNGNWEDVEILYAAGQGFTIFALYPETFARSVQACEQCYGVSLSALQISSDADSASVSPQNHDGGSEGDNHLDSSGGDRPAGSSDLSPKAAPLGFSTLSRYIVESIINSNITIFSWLFASVISFLLSKEGRLSNLANEAIGAEDFTLPQSPPTDMRSEEVQNWEIVLRQAPSANIPLRQAKHFATHTALSESERPVTVIDIEMGSDRHPLFDENSLTNSTSRATPITVSDWVENRTDQENVGNDLPLSISPALDFNQPQAEELPQLISSGDLPISGASPDPTVISDLPPPGNTPSVRPSKPRPNPTKTQSPPPAPGNSPAPPVPSPTPGNHSPSPDSFPTPIVDGSGDVPDLPGTNDGLVPGQPSSDPSNPPIVNDPDNSPNLPGTDNGSDPVEPGGNSSDPPVVDGSDGSPTPVVPVAPVVNDGGSDPVEPGGNSSNPPSISGLGKRITIEILPGSKQVIITDFGGVGTGTSPSQSTIAEADTLKFTGDAAFSAQNMILTQKGEDLVIYFEGVAGTEVVLKNFSMENLDNLMRPSASVDLANVLFNGQDCPQDSYDVFNASWDLNQVLNPNAVTFLNDKDNQVNGFEGSDDVINGQGGNDILTGLGGNDVLRGGDGNDVLLGGSGNNTLTGNAGNDVFSLSTDGFSQINDFTLGQDLIGLPKNISYGQLEIKQGVGCNSNDTWILFGNQPLALVKNTQANCLTAEQFFP
jgi:hypothetical protein